MQRCSRLSQALLLPRIWVPVNAEIVADLYSQLPCEILGTMSDLYILKQLWDVGIMICWLPHSLALPC